MKTINSQVCTMMHKVRAYLKCDRSTAMRLAWSIVRMAINSVRPNAYREAFFSFVKQEKRAIRNRNISLIFSNTKG